jgi:FtsP/CotA-like multicopper oxidase with cupredoxin domain
MNGKNWVNLPENSIDLKKLGTDLLKYPIESFNVKPNKKYLFRVIGANAAFALQISFEGHKLRVISTDGNPMQPIENVDILMVHGGERYDIELETKNETFANNFLILVKILAITDEKFDGKN